MADLNLNELRKVAEAATPGPWLRNPNDRCEVLAENDDQMFPEFPFEFVITDCNGQASISEQDFAHIIAFHPPTVLALLDRVAELEDQVSRADAEYARHVCDRDALADKVARVEALADEWERDWDDAVDHGRSDTGFAARKGAATRLRAALAGESDE